MRIPDFVFLENSASVLVRPKSQYEILRDQATANGSPVSYVDLSSEDECIVSGVMIQDFGISSRARRNPYILFDSMLDVVVDRQNVAIVFFDASKSFGVDDSSFEMLDAFLRSIIERDAAQVGRISAIVLL